jgi:hypothetical protein
LSEVDVSDGTFARDGQFHSHDTVDLDAHFAARRSNLRPTFDKLVDSLPTDVHVDSLASVIVVSAQRTFAYVVVQAKRLVVGVFLDHPLDSARVIKIDRVSARKVASEIAVRHPGDIDDELCEWLSRAYQLRSGTSNAPT